MTAIRLNGNRWVLDAGGTLQSIECAFRPTSGAPLLIFWNAESTILMKMTTMSTIVLGVLGSSAAFCQAPAAAPRTGPGVQAPQDAK